MTQEEQDFDKKYGLPRDYVPNPLAGIENANCVCGKPSVHATMHPHLCKEYHDKAMLKFNMDFEEYCQGRVNQLPNIFEILKNAEQQHMVEVLRARKNNAKSMKKPGD